MAQDFSAFPGRSINPREGGQLDRSKAWKEQTLADISLLDYGILGRKAVLQNLDLAAALSDLGELC